MARAFYDLVALRCPWACYPQCSTTTLLLATISVHTATTVPPSTLEFCTPPFEGYDLSASMALGSFRPRCDFNPRCSFALGVWEIRLAIPQRCLGCPHR